MDMAERSSNKNSDRSDEIKSFKEADLITFSASTGALALAVCSLPLSVGISTMFRPDFPGLGILFYECVIELIIWYI